MKPLLSILHRDAALTFDGDNLLPIDLTRGLSEEALDNLSGGTREQIAILTGLAFARLFARQGKHMCIILDDAHVYSDDDRIIKMFTALTLVAVDQQIIVFSCRQLAFQDLGGARPTVQVSDVDQRAHSFHVTKMLCWHKSGRQDRPLVKKTLSPFPLTVFTAGCVFTNFG